MKQIEVTKSFLRKNVVDRDAQFVRIHLTLEAGDELILPKAVIDWWKLKTEIEMKDFYLCYLYFHISTRENLKKGRAIYVIARNEKEKMSLIRKD